VAQYILIIHDKNVHEILRFDDTFLWKSVVFKEFLLKTTNFYEILSSSPPEFWSMTRMKLFGLFCQNSGEFGKF
jgi:hypothetical protein